MPAGDGMAAYEVFKAVGKGKFAVVYRAKRKSDGEDVALKRVSVGQMDERARTKALKEVGHVKRTGHSSWR